VLRDGEALNPGPEALKSRIARKGSDLMPKETNHPISEPERTSWGQVFLLVGAGVVAAFQVGQAPPVLPDIRTELGMSLFSYWPLQPRHLLTPSLFCNTLCSLPPILLYRGSRARIPDERSTFACAFS